MKTNYEIAYEFTASWEGGLSDHPADRGGITNFGVSLAYLKGLEKEAPALLARLRVPLPAGPDSVRGLTREQAKALFRHSFWDALKLDEMALPIAAASFDCAVNSGPARAVRCLQASLNRFGANLAVDGAMGPLTRQAARSHAGWPAVCVAQECVIQREAFLEKLVAANPSQAVFRRGWLNRTGALKNFVATLA